MAFVPINSFEQEPDKLAALKKMFSGPSAGSTVVAPAANFPSVTPYAQIPAPQQSNQVAAQPADQAEPAQTAAGAHANDPNDGQVFTGGVPPSNSLGSTIKGGLRTFGHDMKEAGQEYLSGLVGA